MSKNIIILVISIIISLIIGFFVGSEYTKYQVRTAIQQAFTSPASSTNTTSAQPQPTQEEKKQEVIIEKQVNEDVELTTLKFKVNSSEEKQILQSKYSSPKVADQGTKFVLVNLTVENTTKEPFSLTPDFALEDNKGRLYKTYSDTIFAVDNSLDYKELSPGVSKTGVFIYQIPEDSKSYSLKMGKAGTNEIYKVTLK